MSTNNELKRIEKIKAELEELELQLNLGMKDAKDQFFDQKKKVIELLEESETFLKQMEEQGDSNFSKLKHQASDLLEILEADYDISYTEFEDKPAKLSSTLEDMRHQLDKYTHKLDEQGHKMKEKLEVKFANTLGKLEARIAVQRKRLAHKQEKSHEEFDQWKDTLLSDVKSLRHKIETRAEKSGKKYEGFSEEITEAYDHLKKAISKLS
jgi:CII-binding regulator of phage lambda lysogenization HflD